jgi:hypothetical protein
VTGQPQDPVTPLAESATQMHEMYTSLLQAGFSAQQALYLVGQVIAASIGGAAKP